MRIGIIGAGNIGANIARLAAAVGHDVRLANSRGPETLRTRAATLGEGVTPAVVAEAAEAPLVLLALPWPRRRAALAAAGPMAGSIVIDAMNPYLDFPTIEELGERGSSEVVAAELPRARIVKAFNTMLYTRLEDGARPPGAADRIAVPICGDDGEAKAAVAGLIDEIGFDPVDAGNLKDGRRQEPAQPLYDRDYSAEQIRAELARILASAARANEGQALHR